MPRRAYANFPRRFTAFAIDAIVFGTIVPNLRPAVVETNAKSVQAVAPALAALGDHLPALHVADSVGGIGGLLFLAYVVLFAGFAGQTFGMMIMDLRVVGERFERIGLGRALFRYVCLIGSLLGIVGIPRIFGRIQPFEKWSKTRLIAGGAYARSLESITAQPFEMAAP